MVRGGMPGSGIPETANAGRGLPRPALIRSVPRQARKPMDRYSMPAFAAMPVERAVAVIDMWLAASLSRPK